MTRRNLLVPLILVVLASLGAVLGVVASSTKPILGLDLQGGFSVVLQAKEVNGKLPSEESVEKAKDIIRQRVDGLGVAEPDITRQGRTVIVQLPGVKNRAKAESLVGCTAKLEFRPVMSLAANPDSPLNTTTTAKPKGSKSTTTTRPKGSRSTTTTKPKSTTTTSKPKGLRGSTPTTVPSGQGETGSGVAGVAPGEGAPPAEFAPTTTTTTAPPTTTTTPVTTTTAAGATTTTVAGATTTTAAGATTTTVAGDSGGSASCGSAQSGAKAGSTTTTTAATTPGSVVYPSKDGGTLYTLGPVGMTGDALSSAKAALAQDGGWEVNVSVKGSRRTEANAAFNACYTPSAQCAGAGAGTDGQQHGLIAIVLDGTVISAPMVEQQNLAADNFRITGNFSEGEAKDLALVLRYGALPVEFKQAALQQVSATLGQDSLHAGLIAGAIGIAAVALYMILYYRALGFVVVVGLSVWGGLMYGLVCWLGQAQGLALTLFGITGIIVSVGTTVDSYVVFFERIKDEVRIGKSVRALTERGFHSAIRTILTADISSFIGAFLLWYLTVGPVRGFAFFLGISVLLDLLVAYLFTRPLVILLGRSKRFTNARFLGLASALDRAPTVAGAPA